MLGALGGLDSGLNRPECDYYFYRIFYYLPKSLLVLDHTETVIQMALSGIGADQVRNLLIGVIAMNTLKRSEEQINNGLIFTAKAGFTNAENLQQAADRNRRGFPAQLIKKGLLLGRKMPGGRMIFGLSQAGADLVGAKKFDIHKVTLGRVEHALIAQAVTLAAVKDFGVVDYQFEPQQFIRDTRPDVIWIFADETELYIEVELSPKSLSKGEMDRFFLKLLSSNTLVVFADPVIYSRYVVQARQYMKSGIPNWKCLEGKWIKFDGLIKYDRNDWDGIEFQLFKGEKRTKLSLIFDAVQNGF